MKKWLKETALPALRKAAVWLAKQVAAPFTDPEWDLDVFRILGVAAYVLAGYIALTVTSQIATLETSKVIAGAGLASLVGGFGTALLGYAQKSDAGINQG